LAERLFHSKNPKKARAGHLGARARWGEQRIARLDQLDPRVREAVLALIRADEAAREREEPSKAA
jgi:hypothetical protein